MEAEIIKSEYFRDSVEEKNSSNEDDVNATCPGDTSIVPHHDDQAMGSITEIKLSNTDSYYTREYYGNQLANCTCTQCCSFERSDMLSLNLSAFMQCERILFACYILFETKVSSGQPNAYFILLEAQKQNAET